MKDHVREAIRQKLGDALELPFPKLTARVSGGKRREAEGTDTFYP